MLTDEQRRFLEGQRVARLATADAAGAPHVVPVCFALLGDKLYIAIDEKPKGPHQGTPGAGLKRLRNIAANPSVALVADHYDDADWSQLGWVMVRGQAEILQASAEHRRAQDAVRARYPQVKAMRIDDRPVIAIRIDRVAAWGELRTA